MSGRCQMAREYMAKSHIVPFSSWPPLKREAEGTGRPDSWRGRRESPLAVTCATPWKELLMCAVCRVPRTVYHRDINNEDGRRRWGQRWSAEDPWHGMACGRLGAPRQSGVERARAAPSPLAPPLRDGRDLSKFRQTSHKHNTPSLLPSPANGARILQLSYPDTSDDGVVPDTRLQWADWRPMLSPARSAPGAPTREVIVLASEQQ